MNRPKVSVSLITYNQEKYIAECLDSIVKQQVGFEIEIVVADDCSADRTPEIVAAYAAKYPGLIKPILRKTNLGMTRNALDTIKKCSGQYIALMTGDDFWTDVHKLQMQADYLDKNTDCALCYTNGYIFFDDEPVKKQFFITEVNKPPGKFDLDFFIRSNILVICNTKMFRSEIQPEFFPDWIYSSINWDWVLYILLSSKGNIGYIDVKTLAYRRHAEAVLISTSKITLLQNSLFTITELNKYLNYKYADVFKRIWWEHHELSFAYLKKRHMFKFFVYYGKYLNASGKRKMNFKDELWRLKTSLWN